MDTHFDGLSSIQRSRRKQSAKTQVLRRELLTHYSKNGSCTCVRCGFGDVRALSLDHIEGNGHYLRSKGKEPRGSTFYKWIKENGFPTKYQTLCMNCQFIKRSEKGEENMSNHEKMWRDEGLG